MIPLGVILEGFSYKDNMKVIVAGSRNIESYAVVSRAIKESGFNITEIISGTANGVDKLGEEYAIENGIKVKQFHADWNKHGKRAGAVCNLQMAEYADACITVWDGESKGTLNMQNTAKKLGLPLYTKEIQMETILLIDGDVVAYRATAACETREVEVTYTPTGSSMKFPNRTKFKEFLAGKNKEFNPDKYKIEDIQTAQDVKFPIGTIKIQLDKMQEATWASKYELYLSGEGNFRDELELPTRYKANRDDMIRPVNLAKVRNRMKMKFDAKVIDGMEVDDYLIVRGYELKKLGYNVVIATVDKDANAYSGLCLYNYTDDNPEIVEIPEVGMLYLDESKKVKKVKGLGFLWFCHQMLIGDVTDGFKPTALCNSKFGEKSSLKLLQECKTKTEALQLVVNQYKEWYPDIVEYTDWRGDTQVKDWLQIMQMYFKCARMKSSIDDELDLMQFLREHGVEL